MRTVRTVREDVIIDGHGCLLRWPGMGWVGMGDRSLQRAGFGKLLRKYILHATSPSLFRTSRQHSVLYKPPITSSTLMTAPQGDGGCTISPHKNPLT